MATRNDAFRTSRLRLAIQKLCDREHADTNDDETDVVMALRQYAEVLPVDGRWCLIDRGLLTDLRNQLASLRANRDRIAAICDSADAADSTAIDEIDGYVFQVNEVNDKATAAKVERDAPTTGQVFGNQCAVAFAFAMVSVLGLGFPLLSWWNAAV